MTVIEYSIVCVAAAFIVLVIYLIVVLRSTKTTLDQVNKTLTCAKQQLNEVTLESIKIIQNTQKITSSIEQKIQSLDPLFQLVEVLSGKALNSIVPLKEKSLSCIPDEHVIENEEDDLQEKPVGKTKVDAVIQFVGSGINLWKKFKRK